MEPLYFSDLIGPAFWCAFAYWLISHVLVRQAKKKAAMQTQPEATLDHAQNCAHGLAARPADATGGLDRTAQVGVPAVPQSTWEVQSA